MHFLCLFLVFLVRKKGLNPKTGSNWDRLTGISDSATLSGYQVSTRSIYCLQGPWFLHKGILPLELSRAYDIIYIYIESWIIALTYNLWRCCNFPSEEGIPPVSILLDRLLWRQDDQTSISIIVTMFSSTSTAHGTVVYIQVMKWDGVMILTVFSSSQSHLLKRKSVLLNFCLPNFWHRNKSDSQQEDFFFIGFMQTFSFYWFC